MNNKFEERYKELKIEGKWEKMLNAIIWNQRVYRDRDIRDLNKEEDLGIDKEEEEIKDKVKEDIRESLNLQSRCKGASSFREEDT